MPCPHVQRGGGPWGWLGSQVWSSRETQPLPSGHPVGLPLAPAIGKAMGVHPGEAFCALSTSVNATYCFWAKSENTLKVFDRKTVYFIIPQLCYVLI